VWSGVVWDNDVPLHEQAQEAQERYHENIGPKLSYYVSKELKEEYVRAHGLTVEIPNEELRGEYLPVFIDRFCRPKKWVFDESGFHFDVENIYMNENENWNLNYVMVKISNNG
jgi:hypothetical protein